jgi:hypothetical protein
MNNDLTATCLPATIGLDGDAHPAGEIMTAGDTTTFGTGAALVAHVADLLTNSVTVSLALMTGLTTAGAR